MEFGFDEKKSQSNAAKIGIDFEAAKFLWCDARRVLVEARSKTEPRFALIATLGGKIWTAIYTTREERIRIISVGRSRDGEEEGYHNS
ncbi:MAG: BrnT family toxin [Verrucomicrobiae bacterium]|nr:BrnT family toxin [Verrucomicrobiae bacterium]NNJ85600.1 BrnT family toxin [Akkermansiaceae bacterium]